ncbi:MAG TPA: hypothetical protein VFQ47_00730, partial [Nitrososphaera sp.]|nr:hypothetical protein [Nitrososphaera sp.]
MIDLIVHEFALSTKALRDYVELIRPFLEEHIKKLRATRFPDITPIVIAVLKSDKELLEKFVSKEVDSEKLRSLIERYPAEIIRDESGTVSFNFTTKDASARQKIASGIKTFERSFYQEGLLYRSSLLNLIS